MSRSPDVEAHLFEDDGRIPNNPRLPLLLYRRALPASEGLRPECEKLFRDNGWGGIWVNGVFPYHHYHSTAHEALGVVRGSARITFGGESGGCRTLQRRLQRRLHGGRSLPARPVLGSAHR